MKAVVIINEQHSLLPEQKKILDERMESWEIFHVPSSGWTLEEMRSIKLPECDAIIFASPVPYLMKELAYNWGASEWNPNHIGKTNPRIYVFHNDRREKKELPDGRIIYTIAKEGWQLV